MITCLHPSRGRPEKSFKTYSKWSDSAEYPDGVKWLCSLDYDDDIGAYVNAYTVNGLPTMSPIQSKNRSCVDAINNAAKHWRCDGDIFVVVSDDTDCFKGWDTALLKELEGKSDYLLKCKDGIQDYIVTMTVMDRKYYERDGFIYHPDFFHQFADTYMTCVADIRGRLVKSNLEFPHRHYSYSGGREMADELNKRNDATWMTGQDTFVRLMKEFTPEERARIKNPGMRGFMKRVGL